MRRGDAGAARRALSHARAAFVRAAVHDGEREVEELEAQLDRLEAAGGTVREAAAALADAQQVRGLLAFAGTKSANADTWTTLFAAPLLTYADIC